MDGWAVAGAPPWRVVGQLLAGGAAWDRLEDGTAVLIATGAPVPAGTRAVLRREDGSLSDELLHPSPETALPDGLHIRPAGEEARSGDVLLPAGTRLTPPALGLAAAAGHDDLLVHPAARVRTFVLGDELLDAGPSRDGCVRDAVGPQLPGWVAALGATAAPPVRLPDRLDVLLDLLTAAIHPAGSGLRADVLVTTGGSSVGPADHVRAAIERLGGQILVDGVLVRPGHPMALAWLPGDVWLVVLPGNPFAACAAVLTLLQPLLHRLHGSAEPVTGRARLGVDVPTPPHAHRLLPARATDRSVTPLPYDGPGMLRGLALADTVLAVPPGGAFAGDDVIALALPWSTTRRDVYAGEITDEGTIA